MEIVVSKKAGPRALILAVAGFVTLTGEGRAQSTEEPDSVRDRIFVSVTLGGAVAVGEFADFVDSGGGIGVAAEFHLDDRRMWTLRTDFVWLVYGHEGRDLRNVRVGTNNAIFALQIGPQFTVPGSRIRPYFFGTGGFSNFKTSSSGGEGEEERGGAPPLVTETHLSKYTWSGTFGGGVLVRVHQGKSPVFIDISTAYLANGRVRYLTKESIQEAIKSQANLILLRLGVSVGVG